MRQRRTRSRSPSRPRRATPRTIDDGHNKRVALIGSSGGSTLRSNARDEFDNLQEQLRRGLTLPGGAIVTIEGMCFVEAQAPLDHADQGTHAVLWTSDQSAGGGPTIHTAAPLSDVNVQAARLDGMIAAAIERGEIDALVLVSADTKPGGINRASLDAAIRRGTPCLGTGGASLGHATESGATVLQLSGSVSTTSESRAVATAAALARHWAARFTPRLPAPALHVLPILDAALPVVLTLSLLRASLHFGPGVGGSVAHGTLADAAYAHGIASVLGALAGRRTAQCGESGLIAGVLAAALPSAAAASSVVAACGPAAVAVAALVGGGAAGLAVRRALGATHAIGLPATASTLITVGGAGAAGGLIGCASLPAARVAVRTTLRGLSALAAPDPATWPLWARAVAGALLGCGTKWGSIRGYYHSVMFPLILLEMADSDGGFALLGALDAACLCCVCAGVCAAAALTTPAEAEARACRRAVGINLLLGDYVEACYPLMDKSAAVRAAAYLGAALAGSTLGCALGAPDGGGALGVRSSAYLPMPLAVAVAAPNSAPMAYACALAFSVPFVLCWAAYRATGA